jgi:DNA repair exonuclease SbcCD ATPase subunit
MWSKTFLKNYFVTLLSVVFCLVVFVFIYNAQAKEGAGYAGAEGAVAGSDATGGGAKSKSSDQDLKKKIKAAKVALEDAETRAEKAQNEVDSYEEPGGPAFSKDDDEAVLAREEVSRLAARLEALNKQAKEEGQSDNQDFSEDPNLKPLKGNPENTEADVQRRKQQHQPKINSPTNLQKNAEQPGSPSTKDATQ